MQAKIEKQRIRDIKQKEKQEEMEQKIKLKEELKL